MVDFPEPDSPLQACQLSVLSLFPPHRADSQKDGCLVLLPRAQPRPHARGQVLRGTHSTALLAAIQALRSIGVCINADVAGAAERGDGLIDVKPGSNMSRQASVALHVVSQGNEVRRLRSCHAGRVVRALWPRSG